ncbi:MAG TPA: PSD1 and planctomycete cytochrome C domain-containing protein [Verrucomicrobiales bacterium]|nr:PSD1 and planctomycete cytochrome C domain-containing protein [Verrucomicrobiales bacterium]
MLSLPEKPLATLLLIFGGMFTCGAAEFTPEQIQFFETKVRPVLVQNCTQCHGAEKQKSGLRLDSRAGVLKGGEEGPAVEAGKPDASRIIKAVRHEKDVKPMPHKADKLPEEAIASLAQWVAMGLPWPEEKAPPPEKWREHWAFQPVKVPPVPEAASLPQQFPAWMTEPMDRIILQKLTETGLTPSAPAEREVLIRRAYVSLLGYPPTFEQVQAFVKDAAPDALPRLVDSLLASPHFGERWARHWMDTARYADTKGYVFQEERRYAYAYTYRDWLIRAFNADMPYDQFLTKQIAADRSTDWQKDPADLAAMGFLTLGRRFLNNQADIIDDRLDVVFRGTQAMTVGCARCHDHKFDPIPTADYYALYGVFSNSHEPDNKPEIGKAAPSPELEAYNKGAAERQAKVDSFKKARFDEALKDDLREKYRTASADAGDKRDRGLRDLARDRGLNTVILKRWVDWRNGDGKNDVVDATKSPPSLKDLNPEDLVQGYTRKDREALNQLKSELEKFKATNPAAPPRAMVMFDNNNFNEPVIFERGNPGRRGASVQRHFLTALSPGKPQPLTEGSGRLQLAQAIASRDNPLTARVFVNRVWTALCGEPLVDTPADFGVRTAPPANPALLDYLADTFMREGWSVKKLMRRILLSAAWQQSSVSRADMEAKDPFNKFFWRQNRQRLDFEALRDCLLQVSGAMDTTMFGRPVDILTEPYTGRRTVYGFIDRQNLPGLFRTFDFASPDNSNPKRYETTVPQQALFMMNSPFVLAQTKRLIKDLDGQPDKDTKSRIAHLYRRILQREPSATETETSLRALESLQREPRQTGTRWQNGYGQYDEVSKTVKFTPFPWYGKESWRGSEQMPDPQLSYTSLSANGGHPGSDAAHAAIRRWNAPETTVVRITGDVFLLSKESRGIRALIVHSRKGIIWKADIPPGGKAASEPGTVAVQPGDTIDFILDNAGDPGSDSFNWAPVIHDAMSGLTVASAAKDFGGPGTSTWEAYAQVLLCTNEFLFVD